MLSARLIDGGDDLPRLSPARLAGFLFGAYGQSRDKQKDRPEAVSLVIRLRGASGLEASYDAIL